ncbi:MAG: hypothetical protein K8R88_11515 [Armatimonadetes bacterium]|nr:hypothetical protein [Armatimonadota bacterium]
MKSFGVLVLSLAVVGCTAGGELRHRVEALAKSLPEAEAAARKAGLPVSSKDIGAKPIPDSENGWILIRKALATPGFTKNDLPKLWMLKWGTKDQPELERRLKLAAPGFALVAQGCAKKSFGVPNFLLEDSFRKSGNTVRDELISGESSQFASLAELKDVASAYAAKLLSDSKKGTYGDLQKDCEVGLRLGDVADSCQGGIGRMVGAAIRAIIYRNVEFCLTANPKLGVALLPALHRDGVSPRAMGKIAITESIFDLDAIRNVTIKDLEMGAKEDKDIRKLVETGLAADVINKAIITALLRWYTDLCKDLQGASVGRETVRIAKEKYETPMSSQDPIESALKHPAEMTPKFLEIFVKDEASAATLRGLIAVLNFKEIKGRFPKSLKECGFESVDPFTGQPLGYVVKGGEVRVYSVGADRKDNAGLERKEVGAGAEVDIVAKYPRLLQQPKLQN